MKARKSRWIHVCTIIFFFEQINQITYFEMQSNIERINNLGLRYLRVDEVDKAFQFFQKALVESIKALSITSTGRDDFISQSSEHRLESVTRLMEDSDKLFMDVYDDELFIYEQVNGHTFVFFEVVSEDSIEECALRCIFNLATFHYWKGFSEIRSSHLRTANRLYELSYELMASKDSAGINPLLFLVAMNNLGQIHGLLGETWKSEKCFERLLRALFYFSTSDGGESVFPAWDQLKESFFANTTHLTLTNHSFAPAA
jgi:tetratricopeptide (TPR) repeat protein